LDVHIAKLKTDHLLHRDLAHVNSCRLWTARRRFHIRIRIRIEDEEEPNLCGRDLISLILEAEHLGDMRGQRLEPLGLISPIRAARGEM